MARSIVALLALVALSCARDQAGRSTRVDDAGRQAAPGVQSGDSGSGSAGAHGSEHRLFAPEQIPWKDGPASLPPGAQVAMLDGDPSKPGYFAMRLKFPDGYKVPPHWHPGVERVTVISGTLHLGNGETFDPAATRALPAGSYSSMTPGMRHFAWAKGETVLQLSTIGPWEINYINPADDPRRKGK